MAKQQTAVEFAVEWLENFIPSGNQLSIFAIFEQAKQMEKEQTLDFASKVLNRAECSWSGIVHINEPLEDIYNETYGELNQ